MLETVSQSMSLAHRYYDDSLSEQENLRLFGSSTSPRGLGHNMKVSVSFLSGVLEQHKKLVLDGLKSRLDHQSFITSGKSSSLEVLAFNEAQKLPSDVVALEFRESPSFCVSWERTSPSELSLIYSRFVSVLWKEGGGARIELSLVMKSDFDVGQQVLVERSLLEEGLEFPEDLLLSRKVKDNQEVMDALFKEIHLKIPSLVQIKCELEKGKKWLIHKPFLTR